MVVTYCYKERDYNQVWKLSMNDLILNKHLFFYLCFLLWISTNQRTAGEKKVILISSLPLSSASQSATN